MKLTEAERKNKKRKFAEIDFRTKVTLKLHFISNWQTLQIFYLPTFYWKLQELFFWVLHFKKQWATLWGSKVAHLFPSPIPSSDQSSLPRCFHCSTTLFLTANNFSISILLSFPSVAISYNSTSSIQCIAVKQQLWVCNE